MYGEPRETRDAVFAVVGWKAARAAACLCEAGIDATVAFEDVTFGGLRVSRVRLFGGASDTGLKTIHLVEPRDDAFATRVLIRAVTSELRGGALRIVSLEDYVVLKLLSTRDRDIEDAASASILDRPIVDDEVRALSVSLPDVVIVERLARADAPVAALASSGTRSP